MPLVQDRVSARHETVRAADGSDTPESYSMYRQGGTDEGGFEGSYQDIHTDRG